MTQLTSIATNLLVSELQSLRREILAFPDDSGPWMPRPGITNTAGTLALHCAGNIQHFVGARLGSTAYVRQRELEFSRRDVPREEIAAEIDKAIAAVHTLDGKVLGDLPPVFPDALGGKQVNTDVMLAFLMVHLAYHLGQVDYHRRMTTPNAVAVNTIPASELPPAVT